MICSRIKGGSQLLGQDKYQNLGYATLGFLSQKQPDFEFVLTMFAFRLASRVYICREVLM